MEDNTTGHNFKDSLIINYYPYPTFYFCTLLSSGPQLYLVIHPLLGGEDDIELLRGVLEPVRPGLDHLVPV